MINNGIISNGDNNVIINNQNEYDHLKNEIEILLKKTNDVNIKNLMKATSEKNESNIKKIIKSLSKETLFLIKSLSLSTIQTYIEKYIIK